jgi:hypothetical protein
MMISGLSSLASISFSPLPARPQTVTASGDRLAMSLSADTFSSLVREAGRMPEVRSNVIGSFKSRIQAGSYPTDSTLDRLANLMGGAWARQAQAGDVTD